MGDVLCNILINVFYVSLICIGLHNVTLLPKKEKQKNPDILRYKFTILNKIQSGRLSSYLKKSVFFQIMSFSLNTAERILHNEVDTTLSFGKK